MAEKKTGILKQTLLLKILKIVFLFNIVESHKRSYLELVHVFIIFHDEFANMYAV